MSSRHFWQRTLVFAALIAAAALVSGCLGGGTGTFNVRLHIVEEETDAPLPGAVVRLGQRQQTTNQQGLAEFTVREGTLDLQIEVAGAVQLEDNLIVNQDIEQIIPVAFAAFDWRQLLPMNPANEFDRMGEFHNRLVDRFAAEAPGEQEVIGIVNFLVPEALAMGAISSDEETAAYVGGAAAGMLVPRMEQGVPNWEDFLDMLKEITDQIRGELAFAITNGDLQVPDEEAALDFLDDLLNSSDALGNDTVWGLLHDIEHLLAALDEDTVQDSLAEFKALDALINGAELTAAQKQMLLTANSTARYSTAFWAADNDNPDTPWPKAADDEGRRRWVRIVGRDVTGGLTGFLGGGWGGALVGAAVSSIDEALGD